MGGVPFLLVDGVRAPRELELASLAFYLRSSRRTKGLLRRRAERLAGVAPVRLELKPLGGGLFDPTGSLGVEVELADPPRVGPPRRGAERLRSEADSLAVLATNPSRLLMEVYPEKGGGPEVTFILSRSEPFNEESAIELDRTLAWLSLFGVEVYYRVHSSGHAAPDDLADIIERIDPERIVPVHSEHPELLREYLRGELRERVRLVRPGETVEV